MLAETSLDSTPECSQSLLSNAADELNQSEVFSPDSLDGQLENSGLQEQDDVAMTVFPCAPKMDEKHCSDGNILNNNGSTAETHSTGHLPHQGSPNRAIFEFKHQDTDIEESPQLKRKGIKGLAETTAIKEKVIPVPVERNTSDFNLNLAALHRRGKNRQSWPQRSDPHDESDGEALQKLIDSAILDPDWLKVGSDGADDGSTEEASDEVQVVETMDTGSEGAQTGESASTPKKLNSSIHQLVTAAEHLVQPSPLPSPIVSPRLALPYHIHRRSHGGVPKNLAPLHFDDCAGNKQQRIQKWLATQRPNPPALLDSCDASGEMTTGESDDADSVSSDSAGEVTQMAKDLSQSVVNTPVAEGSSPQFPGFGFDGQKVNICVMHMPYISYTNH